MCPNVEFADRLEIMGRQVAERNPFCFAEWALVVFAVSGQPDVPEFYALAAFERGAEIGNEVFCAPRREAVPFQADGVRERSVAVEVRKGIQAVILVRSLRRPEFRYAAVRRIFSGRSQAAARKVQRLIGFLLAESLMLRKTLPCDYNREAARGQAGFWAA